MLPQSGGEPFKRDILLFFKGDVGLNRDPPYSRGVRQKLYKLSKDGGWREKHRIFILGPQEAYGQYSQLLSRSIFCLVATGGSAAVVGGCLCLSQPS